MTVIEPDTDDEEEMLDTIERLSGIYFNLSQNKGAISPEHHKTLAALELDIHALYSHFATEKATQ